MNETKILKISMIADAGMCVGEIKKFIHLNSDGFILQIPLPSNRIHPVVKTINFNKIRRKLHRLLKRDLGL